MKDYSWGYQSIKTGRSVCRYWAATIVKPYIHVSYWQVKVTYCTIINTFIAAFLLLGLCSTCAFVNEFLHDAHAYIFLLQCACSHGSKRCCSCREMYIHVYSRKAANVPWACPWSSRPSGQLDLPWWLEKGNEWAFPWLHERWAIISSLMRAWSGKYALLMFPPIRSLFTRFPSCSALQFLLLCKALGHFYANLICTVSLAHCNMAVVWCVYISMGTVDSNDSAGGSFG